MLLRRIARPLLASWFVSEGLGAARQPAAHVEDARVALALLTRLAPPSLAAATARYDPPTTRQLTQLVQVHGAATLAAGALLAFGRAPRTAALVLAGLSVPLVVANLPFTGHHDPDKEARRVRRDRLVTTLALTGGALLAGADYEGRPGVAWRVSKARKDHTSDAG